MFIMLNPSTADANRDDPTIIKCIQFARNWDYGELMVGNLFAWRSPKPEDLLSVSDPVGPHNDAALLELAQRASRIVAAWGNRGELYGRSQTVRQMLSRPLYALHITGSGQPGHPLYLPESAKPFLI